MAKVNWFPGHMAKTLAQMSKEIKNVDMIIYVLDARAPLSCLNPKFNELCADKPILYILNKVDLADDSISTHIKEMHNDKTVGVIICRKENKYVMEYCTNLNIFVSTYETI